MKILIATILTLSTSLSLAETFKVDPSASEITYVGKKVTGEHTGNVSIKTGSLEINKGLINSGEVIADMNSITSTDITNKELNAQYVGHIKSSDFFNVEKYPEAKILIKSSQKTDKGLEVSGDLTFVGKTNPVTFLVTDIKESDSSFSGRSKLTLNRTKWGLIYGSGSFIKGLGDKTINDEFTLDIVLSAKK